MIVVDSSVWIANLREVDSVETRFLWSMDDPDEIVVGDIVLLEVLQGARDAIHAAKLEQHMREFTVVPFLDQRLATKAAGNFRTLRSLGVTTRKTADLIIATFCIDGEHALLHSDRDFAPFVHHLGLKTLP